MLIKTILLIIFIGQISNLVAQNTALKACFEKADSIIKVKTLDYQKDTVYSIIKSETGYLKGKEIYSFTVSEYGNIWSDSTWILTEYGLDGKKLFSTKIEKSKKDCAVEPLEFSNPLFYSPVDFNLIFDGRQKHRKKRKKNLDEKLSSKDSICFSTFQVLTKYSDLLSVSIGKSDYYEEPIEIIDSNYFLPNHLKQKQVNYTNQKLTKKIRFAYEYDTFGTLSSITQIDSSETDLLIRVTQVNYHGKDTVPIYMYIVRNNDLLSSTESYWVYNEQQKQTRYIGKTNGKLVSFIEIKYDENGKFASSKSFKADSTMYAENIYASRRRKNVVENWYYHSDYESNYGKEITYFRFGKKHVCGYSTTLKGKFEDFKFKRPKKVFLGQHLIFDSKERIIMNRNYDYDTHELISETAFWYSK